MRKLYNVDLPVPSSIQFDNYTTHIIFANDNNSLDTDSQSDIDASNLVDSPTNNNKLIIENDNITINNSTNDNVSLASSFSFNFSQKPMSFIKSLKEQLSLGSLNKVNFKSYMQTNNMGNSRKNSLSNKSNSSSSSSNSEISLNSLSNISNAKLSINSTAKSSKQPRVVNFLNINNNNNNTNNSTNKNGLNNFIDSSQTERYLNLNIIVKCIIDV